MQHCVNCALQLLLSIFLTYGTEFVLFLAVLENSVLPMGVSCLQTFLTPNDVRTWPSYNVIVNILFKASNFPIIGKKNNQSSVSDEDQEIPTLGSTYNAGNSVNLVSGIIRLPFGWGFSVCIGDG